MNPTKEPGEEWKAESYKKWRATDLANDCKPWEGAIHQYFVNEIIEPLLSQAKSQGAREALEGLKKELDGMQFVQPSQAGQFAMHTDGYNQGIEEAIEVIENNLNKEKI